jgi:hypothetical protein
MQSRAAGPGGQLVVNAWNLTERHTGEEARPQQPLGYRTTHIFSPQVQARMELLEEWMKPSSNPGLAGDEYEALAFDEAGNLIGRIRVRDEYDIDLLDEREVKRADLITDERGHRQVSLGRAIGSVDR